MTIESQKFQDENYQGISFEFASEEFVRRSFHA